MLKIVYWYVSILDNVQLTTTPSVDGWMIRWKDEMVPVSLRGCTGDVYTIIDDVRLELSVLFRLAFYTDGCKIEITKPRIVENKRKITSQEHTLSLK